jgi:hypothetical protein
LNEAWSRLGRHRRAADMALVILITIAAGIWGARFERAWRDAGREAQFYQSYFEPAVMIACGHGFTRVPARPPALDDFLTLRVTSFSCASLPPDVVPTTSGLYQSAWYYLLWTVGLTWRLFGVSWTSLGPLLGLLFGITIASCYSLFRFAMGRPLALLCTFAMAVSTSHLINLPHLRDYAKAPFVLALIALMAALVHGAASRRRLVIVSAASGAVLGIGYGFRTDLLACIPPLLMSLWAFAPGGLFKYVTWKAQATAALIAVFVIVGWTPIRQVTGQGGCQWHVTLLGLSSYFDDGLHVMPASYDWGPYSDLFLYTAVASHAEPGASNKTGPRYCGTDYDQETAAYLATIARHMPGDFAMRAVASMVSILDLPSAWRTAPLPSYDGGFYSWRQRRLESLIGWGPLLVVPFLMMAAAWNLRIGLWTLFMLLWFGALPMLQFSNRHYFHLEFIGWLVFGASASGLGRVVRRRGRITGSTGSVPWRTRATRAGIVAACCVALAASVVVARVWQDAHVRELITEMTAWTSQRAPVIESVEDDKIAIAPQFASGPREAFWVEYLRIEVDASRCAGEAVTVRYGAPNEDFTRVWTIHEGQRAIMTPVFRAFRDIVTPAGRPGCVRGVYRAPDLSVFPFWMFVDLPTDASALRTSQAYAGHIGF